MTRDQTETRVNPYLLDEQPTSNGRLFLPRAFEHYCLLHWGLSGEEIAASLDGCGPPEVAGTVRMAARLIGEALGRATVRAWTRPFGGGEPVELKASAWELDSFDRRFAAGALDPRNPFDADAEPTSWIFVDMHGWNALVEASLSCEPPLRGRRLAKSTSDRSTGTGEKAAAAAGTAVLRADDDERLVRLEEVKRRTAMSRSSIYRRMEDGRFPQTVPMSGNMAAWRESEVAAWLADPR